MLFPLLYDFFLHNARFKFSLQDGRLNDSSSVSIHTTFASDRIVIYRVCTRERPYLRAYVVPAGCRYRDMGKLKFYDDTANDCMCPLLGTYVLRTRDTLIPPLEFVFWHWFELSYSVLALHVRAKWLSYSPTYTASPWALLTWFLMRIGWQFVESSRFDFAKKISFNCARCYLVMLQSSVRITLQLI